MLRKMMCVIVPDARIATDMGMSSVMCARATASSSGTSNLPLCGKLVPVLLCLLLERFIACVTEMQVIVKEECNLLPSHMVLQQHV